MSPDAIDLDDTELLNDPEMAGTLKPRRLRHPLSFAEVRKLVERLEMGRKRHANIETYSGGRRGRWRLRFSLRDGKGGVVRTSVTIEAPVIAEWVLKYLKQTHRDRPMYRLELREREHRKWLDATPSGGSPTAPVQSCGVTTLLPENNHISQHVDS